MGATSDLGDICFPTLMTNCIFIDESQPQLDKFMFGQHSGKKRLKGVLKMQRLNFSAEASQDNSSKDLIA